MVVIAGLVGTVLAIVIAFLRISRIPVVDTLLKIYISFMRGTPVLIQILIVYYWLPGFIMMIAGLDIKRWDKINFVIIALFLNLAAFLAEVFRGAILAIPAGQTEAGYSIGLTRMQTFIRIVLPQAFRIMIPMLSAELVSLLHSCSLAFMIGVIDLVGAAQAFGAREKHLMEAYFCIALIFIIFSILIRSVFRLVDMRMSRGRA